MPRRTTTLEFPFVEGEHGEADPKVLPNGYLSAARNVRLRKDGRFGVRADFDAVGNAMSGAADWIPYDLAPYRETLLSVGDGHGDAGDTASWDVANLAAASTSIDWAQTDEQGYAPIGRVSGLRQMQGFAASDTFISLGVSRVDCAAAGGYVALVLHDGSGSSSVRVFDAATGATVLHSSVGARGRVVAVGSVFFFVAIDGSFPDDLNLYKFDPASDSGIVTLTPIVTSFAFSSFDICANHAGNGLWAALSTTTPTTKIYPVNSSGVTGTAITGPATAFAHVSVCETASRVHLLTVNSGTCALRSYTTGGTLSTGPTTISSSAADKQAGIADATLPTETVLVLTETTDSPAAVLQSQVEAATHATGSLTWADSFLAAKPAATHAHGVFAGIQADGSFLSNFLAGADDASFDSVYAYWNKFAAAKPQADHLPQIARDASTGKFYLPSFVIDESSHPMAVVTEFEFADHPRRQTAQIAGLAYLSGGVVQAYDGVALVDAGFFEKPRILSVTPSNGTGSLPSSTTIQVAVLWEYRDALNNIYSSDISEVTTVTMGSSDDTITLVVSGPHGTKVRYGVSTLVAYRTASGTDQLRRAETRDGVAAGTTTLTLLLGDDVVAENGVIYTQAARGALSGTLPHEAPLPADYIWKFGDRLLTANADQAQISKSIFPGEPVNWSGAVGFLIPKISGRIVGVATLDQRGLLFSSERIYQFSGDGPNDNGENSYGEPTAIPSSTGLSDWRSLVEAPLGLFFQGSNGQIWILPRDGSPPQWIGQPVRDTLVAYPVVTSATLVTEEQLVSFTCNTTDGTAARIVHYDLRAQTWIVDEFATNTPIAAACSYQGRLAYVSSGIVYTEKTTLTPNAFITHSLTTGTLTPFGATGWGKLCNFDIVGEYRGDCNLGASISYDDGKSYTALHTFQLRGADYAVGDTVRKTWDPLRRKGERFKIAFSATTPGSATEGFVFNKFSIEFMPAQGGSRSRAADRG